MCAASPQRRDEKEGKLRESTEMKAMMETRPKLATVKNDATGQEEKVCVCVCVCVCVARVPLPLISSYNMGAGTGRDILAESRADQRVQNEERAKR